VNSITKHEFLQKANEKRAQEVMRVTGKIMRVFTTPPKKYQEDSETDITSCLLDPSPLEGQNSIFSRDFTGFEERKFQGGNAN